MPDQTKPGQAKSDQAEPDHSRANNTLPNKTLLNKAAPAHNKLYAPSTVSAPKLGVYVHWPFCARICPYCDFNVYKAASRTHSPTDEALWRDALTRDLSHWAAKTKSRPLTSLYFGGGTPSLAPLGVLEAVIETCDKLWGFEAGAEITLEANPTDHEGERFNDFHRIGINRLSVGVQSLRDDALAFLGRDHSAREAANAFDKALHLFPKSSFDLIYARPDQTLKDWQTELREALAFGPQHLSLYQLTVEPGTAFDKAVARGAWVPPIDDIAADLFDATIALTAEAGLNAYEVSNHAAKGAEAVHNTLYWREGDYIGIGPGAHGRLTLSDQRIATEAIRTPKDYLSAVNHSGTGIALEEPLTPADRLSERLSMGLRLKEGCTMLNNSEIALIDDCETKLKTLIQEELIETKNGIIRTTPAGRRVLNAVLGYLLT